MEFNSFEIYQINCLIEKEINDTRKLIAKEKESNIKKELEKMLIEKIEMKRKASIWYQKTLLKELKESN